MTENQKAQICALRKQGVGYMKIAQQMGISQNTIKSFCRRNNLTGIEKPNVPVAIGVNTTDLQPRSTAILRAL